MTAGRDEERLASSAVAERRCIVTFDGRLHNRAELARRVPAGTPLPETDAALVAALYATQGEAVLGALIGDWSVAICEGDGAANRVLLASDYMGNRPLYYHHDGECLAWSSDLRTLLALFPGARDFDARHLAGFLIAGLPPGTTPYRRLHAVTPAHCIAVDASGHLSNRRFWDFSGTAVRGESLADYASQLRASMTEAVRVRLPERGAVWCDLSGGLDSSSIVCLADRLIASQALPVALHTFSCYREDSPETNEREFVDAVNAVCASTPHHIPVTETSVTSRRDLPAPEIAQAFLDRTFEAMAGTGARVLLSGRLGDSVMANIPDSRYVLSDQLAQRDLIGWLERALAWSRALRRPLVETLWASLEPFRAAAVQDREYLQRTGVMGDRQRTYSVRAEVIEALMALHPSYSALGKNAVHPSGRRLLRDLYYKSHTRAFSGVTSDPRVHRSYPYAHRPLVELVLGIPGEVQCAPGRPRLLMREAMAGVLPPVILQRTSKGYAAPGVLRQFAGQAAALRQRHSSLACVELGIVDAASLKDRLDRVLAGSLRELGNLPQIAVLEDWLSHRLVAPQPAALVATG
jgi:asparagine synthase (glutamine-hydrolysing)